MRIKERLKEDLEATLGMILLNGIIIYEPLSDSNLDWKEQLKQIYAGFHNIYEPLYFAIKEEVVDYFT